MLAIALVVAGRRTSPGGSSRSGRTSSRASRSSASRARYLREVVAWQAAGWLLRFASFWLFLDAFHIGGSFDNVLLVMCVQAITGALPFTPGGAGAQQALLVVALHGPTYAAVLAYSVGQQLSVTIWSVAIAFITLGVVFRAWDLRRLIREGREARGDPKPT